MNRIASIAKVALAAVLALGVTAPVTAASNGWTTLGFDGRVVFEGRGSLLSAGFGEAKISGKVELVLNGIGQLTMTEGAKYRYRGESRWRISNGKTLKGAAGLRIRLEQSEKAEFEAVAGFKVTSRAGGTGKVVLEGKGKVAARQRYWRLIEGASNKIPAEDAPGTLPPEDLK